MEVSNERKEKIERLRLQLPFLNEYQKESNNLELKKHCTYILKIFERSPKEDIKLPDNKLDLLINSVEKLREYMNTQPPIENVPAQEIRVETSLNESVASNEPSDTSGTNEIDDVKRKANVERRREKEMRRLHENIVKEPLPSRRALKRSSKYQNFADAEETARRKSGTKSDLSTPETKPAPKITKLDSPKVTEEIKKVEVTKAFSTSTPKIARSSTTTKNLPVITKKLPILLPAKRKSDTTLENVEKKKVLTVVQCKSSEETPAAAKVPPIKITNLSKNASIVKPIAPKPLPPLLTVPTLSETTTPTTSVASTGLSVEKSKINLIKSLQKIEIQPKVQAIVQEKDKTSSTEESFKLKKLVLKIPMHQNKLIKKKKTIRRVLATNEVHTKPPNVEEEGWEDCDEDAPVDDNNEDDDDDDEEEAETEEDKITRNDIKNMTYVAVRQGFIFQCLVSGCWFQTMKKFSFINHLEENHKATKWDGFCKKCGMEVSKKVMSREDEFWHMMERHVHTENSKPDSLPDVVEIPVEMIKNPSPKKKKKSKVPPNMINKLQTKQLSPGKNIEKNQQTPSMPLKKLTLQLTQEIGSIISSQLLKGFAASSQIDTSGANKKEDDPPLQKLKKVSLLKTQHDDEVSEKNVNSLKKIEIKAVVPQMQPLKQDNDPKKGGGISPLIGKKVSIGNLTNLMHKIVSPPQAKVVETTTDKQGTSSNKESSSKQGSGGGGCNQSELTEPISNNVNLRPWISRPAKKFLNRAVKLLVPNSLIATFKCMGPKCEFYTSNAVNFKAHLENHIATAPGNIANYLICPYCDANFVIRPVIKNSVMDLISHIDETHCYDNYQCKYCYYRSCANFNVLTHQRIHHRMQQHAIIEISSARKRDYKTEIATIKEKCKKNIRALMCATCKSHGKDDQKFFVLQHFYSHLKEHEKNKEIIKAKCKKCQIVVDSAESLYSHVFNCFGNIALYQCVYCVFGADSTEVMHEHLSNIHPSEMSLVCMRSSDKPMKEGAKPSEVESTSLRFISIPVDQRFITSCLQEMTFGEQSRPKKLCRPEENESNDNNDDQQNNQSSGIQIKSVFSLSKYGRKEN